VVFGKRVESIPALRNGSSFLYLNRCGKGLAAVLSNVPQILIDNEKAFVCNGIEMHSQRLVGANEEIRGAVSVVLLLAVCGRRSDGVCEMTRSV
jgi:hypothetical protein